MSPDQRRPAYGANPDGPLSQAIAMVGTAAVLCLAGAGLDSLAGTGPILLIVFTVFGGASIFASAYYRYVARIRIEEASKPWARRNAS